MEVVPFEQLLRLPLDNCRTVPVRPLHHYLVVGVLYRLFEFPSEKLLQVVLYLRHVGLDNVVLVLVFLCRLEDEHAGVRFVHPVAVLLDEVAFFLPWDRLLDVVTVDECRCSVAVREERVLVDSLVDVDSPLVDQVRQRGGDRFSRRKPIRHLIWVEPEVRRRVRLAEYGVVVLRELLPGVETLCDRPLGNIERACRRLQCPRRIRALSQPLTGFPRVEPQVRAPVERPAVVFLAAEVTPGVLTDRRRVGGADRDTASLVPTLFVDSH